MNYAGDGDGTSGFTICGTPQHRCLLARGVERVEVSKLLGHAELRVNADVSTHLQEQSAAKAATVMDAVWGR